MSKKVIKLFDTAFAHEKYCGSKIGRNISKNVTWDRSGNIENGDVVFFTDSSLSKVDTIKQDCIKIAWLIEPPVVWSESYNYIKLNWGKFDMILTHNEDLLKISEKFKILPMWYSMVYPEKHGVGEKIKNLSIIASNKKDTDGHKLRHNVINHIKNKINIDLYGGLTSNGKGYGPIDDKSLALSPYRFSIIIENTKSPQYFTEKLIDSFLCGAVPIYWGADSVGAYFNEKGIIPFNSIVDIDEILPTLTIEKYNSMKIYVKENYEKAFKYLCVEDYFYEKYLIDLCQQK
mgnify:CR=1 FL=1|tara:strand:+ start:5253 stop:6119 length:867 start_codon:yes stop_codon:yes gene_type:complete